MLGGGPYYSCSINGCLRLTSSGFQHWKIAVPEVEIFHFFWTVEN